ncbi:MAG: 4Fe-4S ferredoxin, partial [Okeania sp. SIO2D1]|nr:4Fe-4S ferredoxin [Okeania sp. SIO2D1]
LSQKVLNAKLPGYVQLAGGTNNFTVAKLVAKGLLASENNKQENSAKNLNTYIPENRFVSGVAYGSYARVLLSPILEKLEKMHKSQLQAIEFAYGTTSIHAKELTNDSQLTKLEVLPELLWEAVSLANSLVSQIKTSDLSKMRN